MNDNYFRISTPRGEMRAVLARTVDEHECVLDTMSATSDFNDNWISCIFQYLEENQLRVGLLTKIFVAPKARGQGHGRELLQAFMQNISAYSDIDLLLARISNRQADGFSLLRFYGDQGFEPIRFNCGDMLMANKQHAAALQKILDIHHPIRRASTSPYSRT